MTRTAVLILDATDVDGIRGELASGTMPHLAEFVEDAAFVSTRTPVSHRSEMAWAHFLTGGAADDIGWHGWWNFQPDRYESIGTGAPRIAPFYSADPVESIIADVPQSNPRAEVPGMQVFGYAAHSAQIPRSSVPAGFVTQMMAELGSPRLLNNDYQNGWFDGEYLAGLGRNAAHDLDLRTAMVARMIDQTPNWQFLVTTPTEYHSCGHHVWHGIDPHHILRGVDTAPIAAAAHRGVITSLDDHVAEFLAMVGDANVVIGSHIGFQAAEDVVNSVLLPELLHRRAFGRHALLDPDQAGWKSAGMPPIVIPPDRDWGTWLRTKFQPELRDRPRAAFSRLPPSVYEQARRMRGRPPHRRRHEFVPNVLPELDPDDQANWERSEDLGREVPQWYRRFWPRMRAFALPTFDDGRIRVNLMGREREGIVPLADYEQELADIEAFCTGVRDARTGRPLVREIIFDKLDDPMAAGPDADVIIRWDQSTDAVEHDDIGLVGPYPFLRSGSHRERGWYAIRGSDAPPGPVAEMLSPFQATALIDGLRRGESYSTVYARVGS